MARGASGVTIARCLCQIKEITFIKEASANGTDGQLYWFRAIDLGDRQFDFFIPIARTALSCRGLNEITIIDLLKSFENQLLEILVNFSPDNFKNDDGTVPHRFTFAGIDSDYAKYGINCLTAINKAQGIKAIK